MFFGKGISLLEDRLLKAIFRFFTFDLTPEKSQSDNVNIYFFIYSLILDDGFFCNIFVAASESIKLLTE